MAWKSLARLDWRWSALYLNPSGGSCWRFCRIGHAGDDLTIQELHPDRDRGRRGAAFPDGAVLWQIHQTCHSGAEGQVDNGSGHAHRRNGRHSKTSTLFTPQQKLHLPSKLPLFFFSWPSQVIHHFFLIDGSTLSTVLQVKVDIINDSPWALPTLQQATPTTTAFSSVLFDLMLSFGPSGSFICAHLL